MSMKIINYWSLPRERQDEIVDRNPEEPVGEERKRFLDMLFPVCENEQEVIEKLADNTTDDLPF